MVDIIFVNLHGTVLPFNGEPVVRRGFLDFVERHGARKIVLTSYQPAEKACADIKTLGLIGKFYKLCALEIYPYFPQDNTHGPDYRMWAKDFKTKPDRTVVITSIKTDLEQAIWYGIPAIIVPSFETLEDTFSFGGVSVNSINTNLKFLSQAILGKEKVIIIK